MIARTRLRDLEDLSLVVPAIPFLQNAEDLPPKPRILHITPEISRVSPLMCPGAERLRVKSGGLADISATLLEKFVQDRFDVHLAIPNYRNIFRNGEGDDNASVNCAAPRSRFISPRTVPSTGVPEPTMEVLMNCAEQRSPSSAKSSITSFRKSAPTSSIAMTG